MQARNRNFGKLVNGSVQYAPKNLLIKGEIYGEPSGVLYIAEGWKRIVDNRLPPSDGYNIVTDGWDEQATELIRIYRYEPIHHTEADFNAALEQHLRNERTARGYDEREPSDYKDSGIQRWRQDALDWIAYRDAVMMYGLAILNEWKATGVEPSYDEFVANLPRITWTEA